MKWNNKRLLLVIDLLNSGGAQRQLVGLAKLLHDRGHIVRVVSYIDKPFYKPFLDENGVENICIGGYSGRFKYIKVYISLKRQILIFSPHVVVAYLRIPCILSSIIHSKNRSFNLIVSERNTTQKLDFLEKLKFWSYRWADVIVPNSHSQERFIFQHYPEYLSKTVTITNFVDTDIFTPATDKEQHDKPVLLTIGRVTEQKNVLRYLNVLKRIKYDGFEFKAFWYGDMTDAYSNKCKDIIREHGLEDVFEFKEKTTKVVEVYQSVDIFCLPSIYEGFPNVLCEAMSCGLPVVVSDVCDNPDIVDASCGRLFNPQDEDDMYIKIKGMLTLQENALSEMGKASRKKAMKMFSPESFIEKYEGLF